MKVSSPNSMLLVAATACLIDSIYSIRGDNLEPLLTLALGILLLLRGLASARQPAAVVIAGCLLAFLSVGADRGVFNENGPLWMALFIVGAAVIIFWKRIGRFWGRQGH